MGIEQQVYFKSDKAGRLLILTFCIAPVLVPIFAIGTKYVMEDPALGWLNWPTVLSSSAQASGPPVAPVDPVALGTLPSRDVFHSAVFAGPSDWTQRFESAAGETRVAQTSRLSEIVSAMPDVLTRASAGACGVHEDEAEETRGACRAGKSDLSDDLSRSGLALRRAD